MKQIRILMSLLSGYKKLISTPYKRSELFIIGSGLLILLVAFTATISLPNRLLNKNQYTKKGSAQTTNILYVGTGGYSTIQQAINASIAGDTVSIHAGTYPEQVTISRSVTVKAFGDGNVWIEGGCSNTNGVKIQSDNVTMEGVGIRNTTGAAVYVDAYNHMAINNTTIQNWNCQNQDAQNLAGVACWFCSYLTVTNSNFSAPKNFGNGIWTKSVSSKPSQGGHYIAGNHISGGWDGIGQEAEGDMQGGFVKNSTVENNTITNCYDDGIQMEGRDENIIVRYNEVSHCGTGVAFATALVGPLFVYNNNLHDLDLGYYGQQTCFKLGSGGSGTITVQNNICNSADDAFQQTNSGLPLIISTGNCINAGRYVFDFGEQPPSGSSFNGDTLWSTNTSGSFIKWAGSRYADLKSFQAAIGQESGGTQSQTCPLPTSSPVSTPTGPIPTLATSIVTPTPTKSPLASPVPSPTPIPTIIPSTSTINYIRRLASKTSQKRSNSLSMSVGSNASVGDLIFVTSVSTTWMATSASDNRGNSYRIITSHANYNAALGAVVFVSKLTKTLYKGDTITVRFNNGRYNAAAILADEFAGVSSNGDMYGVDQGNNAFPSTTVTTTSGNELLYAVVGYKGPTSVSFSEDADWNPLATVGTNSGSNNVAIKPAYRVANIAGTYTRSPHFGSSQSYTELIQAMLPNP